MEQFARNKNHPFEVWGSRTSCHTISGSTSGIAWRNSVQGGGVDVFLR